MDAEFLARLEQRRNYREPFALATIVGVTGSASARVGSKAIFDHAGQNVHGWVGGGCAERYVGEQVVEAISTKLPRLITARLDDEIFGLGVACGGAMQVFIEPMLQPETIELPRFGAFNSEIGQVCAEVKLPVRFSSHSQPARTLEEAVVRMARVLAAKRGKSGQSLREVKDLPVQFPSLATPAPVQHAVVIIGSSRITQSLAALLTHLGWRVRIIGPSIRVDCYPASVQCQCLHSGFGEFAFSSHEAVVIASQLPFDPGIVRRAIDARSPYIAMVCSRTRALDVLSQLQVNDGALVTWPLFIPAGLDIDAQGPEEIALSIVAELSAVTACPL